MCFGRVGTNNAPEELSSDKYGSTTDGGILVVRFKRSGEVGLVQIQINDYQISIMGAGSLGKRFITIRRR